MLENATEKFMLHPLYLVLNRRFVKLNPLRQLVPDVPLLRISRLQELRTRLDVVALVEIFLASPWPFRSGTLLGLCIP